MITPLSTIYGRKVCRIGALGISLALGISAAVTVSVQPSCASIGVNGVVALSINVSDVSDLYAFQLDISYDPAVLSAQTVSESDFLPSGGTTIFIPGSIDNNAGVISVVAGTLVGPIAGVNGSGPLLTVTFKALAPSGGSTVSISNLALIDSNLNNIGPVSITNGSVIVPSGPIVTRSPYLIGPINNVGAADSVVNITNAGAMTAGSLCPAPEPAMCANVYVFSADEQMLSCCSCLVTPNALVSLSANKDLIVNTLTPLAPSSILVKIVATAAGAGGVCNASSLGSAGATLVSGLAAWHTNVHAPAPSTFTLTETEFVPAALSNSEITRLSSLCGFIQAQGSGYGICASCRSGGLGAEKL